MSAIKIIAYLAAAVLIFFGVLFVWGAFSPQGSVGWVGIGGIAIIAGFALIWFAGRQKFDPNAPTNVTMKVDLSGDVQLDSLKCQSCGGSLSPDNVSMVAGAPVVSCPYCGTTYQLTEAPKW
jgi:hypothetical protein